MTAESDVIRLRATPCGTGGRIHGFVAALLPACTFAALVPPAGAAAQTTEDARPTLQAVRLLDTESLRLDGRLDDPAWQRALPSSDFRQQDPVEGGEPTERTEVRVLYDDRNLYIGVMLYDSEPDGVIGHQRRRDAGLGTDDRFMWILDTFMDGRTGYFFEINPAGLMGDGLLGGSFNKSWDGIWEARVARGDWGWSAEIRIPFSTLNFDPTLDTWGINFQRTIRRRNEEILWSGWRRNQGLFRVVHAGRLTGLEGLSQGTGIEVRPYTVGNWTRSPGQDPASSRTGDVGFDVSYNLTPSLRAALTVNTDFAEVEVDQRRVNLTRFPLRFEERRDFFLEGSGVYAFATSSGPSPYFSRRIGLVDGEPVPIRYGARLGGQAGRFELGFQHLRTGAGAGLGEEDFTVARVKSSILEQSTVGAIYTRRASAPPPPLPGADPGEPQPTAPPDRHTVGWDLDLFTSRFLGNRNLQFEAFTVLHTDPVGDGSTTLWDRSTRGIRLNFPNDVWRVHASLREFGDAYDPAVGFVARRGFRRFQPTIGWHPRPASLTGVRQLSWVFFWEYLTRLDGRLETRREQFTLPEIAFESGDNLSLEITRGYEWLERPFRIRPDIEVPAGSYLNWEWELSGRTAGRRALSASASIGRGGFWSGTRSEGDVSVTLRPSPGWAFTGTYERNEVQLPQGDFTTNLGRLSAAWDVSPWASINSNVQYDDVTRVVGLFARARWILRPGNDLFLVYTHNWREEELIPTPDGRTERRFETLSRGGAAKLTYAIRF